MTCERLPYVPDSPDDDLVLVHQFSVAETYAYHCHEFYEIFYVIRGQAIHEINDETQIIGEGMLLFIRPDDRHAYKYFNRDEFEFININIADRLISEVFSWLRLPADVFDAARMPPSVRLTGVLAAEMRRKFLALADLPAGERRRRAFCALLPEAVLTLYEREEAEGASYAPRWLSDLMHRMDRPEMFVGGLPELLRISPYSQEHLTRCFRKYLNLTPTSYINQKRLSYAAELLTEHTLTPQQAAEKAGFHNISHFYHCFREQYGVTPLQYSQQYSERRMINARYLMGIGRRAMHSCLGSATRYTTLQGGLFAYYMQDGCAQIYISYAKDATQLNQYELGACWDPRLNVGATVHVNRSNYELFKALCASLHAKPVRQVCEMSAVRENLRRLPTAQDYAAAGVQVETYTAQRLPIMLSLLKEAAPQSVGSAEEADLHWQECARAGCCAVMFVYGEAAGAVWGMGEEIECVAVHPRFRRRGFGTMLAAHCARQLMNEAPACTMNLEDTQEAALQFARAAGFVQTACDAIFEL